MIDIPDCFKDKNLYSAESYMCETCPVFLACSVWVESDVVEGMSRKKFLRTLINEGVQPKIIDSAYIKLYEVRPATAQSNRRYHTNKMKALS